MSYKECLAAFKKGEREHASIHLKDTKFEDVAKHTDCFIVNGIKALEGYGVVIVLGPLTGFCDF